MFSCTVVLNARSRPAVSSPYDQREESADLHEFLDHLGSIVTSDAGSWSGGEQRKDLKETSHDCNGTES